MRLGAVTDILEKEYRTGIAEEWDNSGLITGDLQKETGCIFITLDLDDRALEAALQCGADLIITHHPFIFGGIKRITSEDHLGRRIMKVIENGIGVYSMHTNYDIIRMADLNADQLGLTDCRVLSPVFEEDEVPYGFGRTGTLMEPLSLNDLALKVKKICALDAVRVYGETSDIIEKAAVCSGSGKSFCGNALKEGAQVLITGDMDYHTAQDCVMSGLYIIDGGHYGTEYVFIDDVCERLKELLPEMKIIKDDVVQPYSII